MVLTLRSLATALLLATQLVAPAAAQPASDADTPPTPPGPRVLVEYDMEGAAGLDDWRMASAWWPDKYAAGQRLLTEDVNAVVTGLFDAGAAVVDVYDQHGAGQPGFNVLPELLDRRVRRVFHRHDSDEMKKNAYDAVAIVAAHAKTGTGGFMAHTGTFGIVRILNGRSVSEAELSAYSWGERGAPVIFVSGDDRLRDDLLPVMPWLEYVITKRALSPKAVELLPLDEVRRQMRSRAARALRGLNDAKPLRLIRPVQAALRAVPPADLSALKDVPGINYQDGEVRFEAPTLQEAMRGLTALQWIATEMGGQPIVTELLKGMPNWAEIERRREAGYWERWMELETERGQTAVSAPGPDSIRLRSTAAARSESEGPPRSQSATSGEWVGYARTSGNLVYLRVEILTEGDQLMLVTRSMLPGAAGQRVAVRQQGREVAFTLPVGREHVSFSGVLEGEVLSGTTKANGTSGRFEFRRKADIEPSLYDRYAGAYELADGRVIFVRRADRLSADPPSRVERSWLYWMDEAGNMRILIPSSARTFYSGPTYVVPVPPRVEVDFLPDKDGNFHEVLWREADKEAVRGRRTRLYSEQEVQFSNGDVFLAGRLLMPAGAGPFPAVVVVHGGGPANRNWEYQIIADVLARNGIAAVVYDKRGTGHSTGDWRRASLDDLAADASAAATFLRNRKNVDPRKVGFWGISEGGWVAPIAAVQSDAAFLMLVSAPGLSHADLDLLSWESMLRDEQWSEEEIRTAKKLAAVMIKFARTGEGWEEVVARMDAARSKDWFWLTEAGLFNPSLPDHWFWTWYRRQLDHDPRPVLRALRCPILAIYGGKDTTIPEVNRKNVEQALQQANHLDYSVRVFPEADHTMLEVRSAASKDLPHVRRHVPEYFKTILGWLKPRLDLKEKSGQRCSLGGHRKLRPPALW